MIIGYITQNIRVKRIHMPKKETAVQPSEVHPFTTMWGDGAYEAFVHGILESLVHKLETESRLITVNAENLFSADNGMPIYVSYPSIGLAKGISRRQKDFLEGCQLYAPSDSKMKRYNFVLDPVESLEVVLSGNGIWNQRIQTAKILLDVGWR